MQTDVQRQLHAAFWSKTPETRHDPELNAQNTLQLGVQLQEKPQLVDRSSSAQAYTKWAPEVDLCINYLLL